MQNENNKFQLPQKKMEFANKNNGFDASSIYRERAGTPFLNEFTFFLAYFNSIPNIISEANINCEKANEWFCTAYKTEIKDYYYSKRCYKGSKNAKFDDMFYVLGDDLVVNFDRNHDTVRLLFRQTNDEKISKLNTEFLKFKFRKKQNKPEIMLIIQSKIGLDTKSLEITKPKLNIEDNYNDDFSEIHHTILKRLQAKNNKGLVMLHGKPGTGKTFYVRYLISIVKKNVIFLPPDLASNIINPDLISILIDNPNSIFVIEDAERIIVDRETEGNSPVSALLNITDGLLADCLNNQIICSFNTDISKVDSGLLRKGRLIAKYEFKELKIQKAQKLSIKLGFNTKINSKMILSNIYNQDEISFSESQKTNQIGFKTTKK
ncbi:MAG: AAA family ATPase [Cytophagales bacterium]|nr:MAG: AAA family ATPase [Cytophagales bacterium]